MSDLLNSASLVLIPSGYKEDTVYSVVPSDGSGDLSFTRASNGTRVNSAGLVEVCPWNLASYSEEFANAYWAQISTSITANTTNAPNGTLTADTLSGDGTSNAHFFRASPTINSGTVYSLSIYAKKNTNNFLQITYGNGFTTNDFANFDLNNGTIGTIGSSATASITNVGDGWYRCTITATATSTSSSITIAYALITSATSIRIESNTLSTSVFIWGAQLNEGSSAKPYFPTTDRLNVPRLTYQNGGGGCPSLLLEPQRTNLITYSEQFDDASWTKSGITISANNTTSPDGTQNADKLVSTNGSTSCFLLKSQTVTSGAQYTYSTYVKKAGANWVELIVISSSVARIWVNLTNGAIGTNNGNFSNVTVNSMGNDWYRINAVFTSGSTSASSYIVLADGDNIDAFTGNGTSGLFAWGAQLEAGAYPTTYIPTTTASATRVADAIANQTTSIAQAFTDNTKGTVFLDLKNIKFQGGAEARFRFGNSADSLQFALFMDSVGLGVYAYRGSGYAVNVSTATAQKIAIRFNGTSLTGFSQGVQRNTITAGTNYVIETMIDNNTANLGFEINQFILFNSVLTDAECIALTTI